MVATSPPHYTKLFNYLRTSPFTPPNVPLHAPQFEMLKKLELSFESHLELMESCRLNQIEFLSTAFDLTTIDLLVTMGLKKWKIPSGEITNLPYLRKIGALKKRLFFPREWRIWEKSKTLLMYSQVPERN